MIIVDAHTHLGNDIYAGEWSDAATDAAANQYAATMRAAGVAKAFTFTLAGLVSDPQPGNDDSGWARGSSPDRQETK
mgnify:CR=1 FL=1